MATRSKRKMDNSQSINSTGFSQFDTQMELESGNRLSDNEASSYSEDIIESGSFMNSSNKGQKGYKIDDILSKIGFGYIQWYSYAALICCNIAQSMYSYNLPYLELMPDLLCKEQNEFGECTVDDICANSGFQHWKIDWNSETTIHNWMTDNLTLCIGGFKIGLIGSCYYAGVLIATILSQTSDYVGRKRFIQICNFCGVICVYSLYFCEGLNMRMLCCFALGVLNCIYFCSYSYLLEISPNEWRSFANFLFLLTEFFIPKMLGSMYFFSGGKEWTSLFSVSLVLAPLGLFMARFMPESPVYYMNNQNLKMAKTQLQIMADVNERKIPSKYKIIDSSTEQFEEHKVDKCKYFKTGNHCLLLLTMIILLSHSNFNLSMWIFFEKIYRINMFFLNILDTILSSFIIISTYLINKVLGTKTVLIILLFTSLFCSIPLMPGISGISNNLLLSGTLGVSACLNSLSILTYQYISDSFPQVMLPMVIGIVNFGSNIAQIISPQAAEIKAPGPIVIFITSTTLTLTLMILIRRSDKKESERKKT